MEKLLYNWIQDQTQRRVPLSLAIIQNKALSIINTLQNKRGENNSDETKCFSASRGWFMRFKARYSLHNIRVQGEAASADHVAAQSFPGILKEIIESGDYSPKQIFNVDETGLFWKKMPSRTFISQEEKSMPGFKAAKDRLTLLLGSNVEGDLKLKPLLVYRFENPRALKNYVKSTLPVIWKANPKAWVTSILFEEWFTKHFIPEVKQYCSKNNLAYKALLILDNAPGHPVRIADIDPQIKVVFLPPNTTSLLQPMDQGVIASFKAYYLRRTFSQAVKANENDGMELRDFWKSYNILQCPSESSTSTDQPNIDEITTDIVHLANRLPDIAVTTDDIDDLLSSHSQELTDEDLIELEAQSEERISMWAHCYRINAGINTNMALESLNNLLNTNQIKRRSNITIENLLDKIDKLVDEKMWQRILNMERPNANTYQNKVVKSSSENLNYNVTYNELGQRECKMLYCSACQICIHRYKCECQQYAVKTNICKHVHLICTGFVLGT
ncbi:LOW QUALITY PROTEIN: tigger transposable element-derived protein 1-like [Agrilus planipennis]|uniref:LOW QUALITY PROTEIN: tigger transposable element-derived protein 1-like n=1 Tax=Agrilus planipennis TaxID=224129 RepID=A0A7F5RJV3_AGRPL|nr:LOW QUALITY PROTEIN: tigger transposable element-derived protein 1-like [Agrilus planipennis]